MKVRRCAWNAPLLPLVDKQRPVWVRKGVISMSCPKSIVTAESLATLERFGYWKASGGGSLLNENAKTADAILFLNEQWMEEQNSGEDKK